MAELGDFNFLLCAIFLFFTFSRKNICITYIIRRKVQFPVKFSIQFPIYST